MTAPRQLGRELPESAQTADRALQVLNTVAKIGPCRMSDLAQETGLERRILGRLLGSLIKAGLVDRAASGGRYELGTRLIELGDLAERRNGLLVRARPILEDLMNRTSATTILHKVHDNFIAPMLVLTPSDVVSVGYPLGRRIALHEGTGRAALAWLPEARIKAVLQALDEPKREFGERGIAEVQKTEVARSSGEVIRGVLAIGSAVRNRNGQPIAVIAVVAPEGHNPERFSEDVARAARRLTRAVGA